MAVEIVKQPVEALTMVLRHRVRQVLQIRVLEAGRVFLRLLAGQALALQLILDDGQRFALDGRGTVRHMILNLPAFELDF